MARNKFFCLIFALSLFLPFSCFAQSGGDGGGGPGVGDPGGYGQVESENSSAPVVKIDNNFKLDFGSMFSQIGRDLAKNISFSQGLMFSIFAVVYVWSLVSSPTGKKQKAVTPRGSYDAEKVVQRRLKKDLSDWGAFNGGYTYRQILKNRDLLTKYYNDRYSS